MGSTYIGHTLILNLLPEPRFHSYSLYFCYVANQLHASVVPTTQNYMLTPLCSTTTHIY